MEEWIVAHRFRYWLLTAAVVLAVILPVWASGRRPMWPVSVATIAVAGAGAVLVAHGRGIGTWLRHHRD